MKATLYSMKRLLYKAMIYVSQVMLINLSGKMLVTAILLSHFLLASFAQQKNVLLSRYDSCHVKPPQQTGFAIQAVGTTPMVRVAYVIPSNRTPQPNGVANLQNAVRLGQRFFKEQMEQYGLGPKTFTFETEDDGVTPLINVVHVSETDEYLRGDLWNRVQTAASNAGISLWAPGEVWVVIPETHVMFQDGSGIGGVALGAGWGSGDGGGVSMIGSNALPLFKPGMITDDTPYDGKVLPELGPYPMKQDVTFNWFEGTTLSSVASSWLGALWHETGHGFGLGHDFRNDDNFHGNLMGNGLRGIRGTLFPEKYPQDYTRLEYWTSLFLNVNHFFNSGKIVTNSPTVSHSIPGSVTPEQGLVHLPFQVSDPDGLSFAYVVLGGDMAAEMVLDGTTANPTFAIPYFRQGDLNRYIIFTVDKQGNKTNTDVAFTVPAGNNQAPFPFIRITPPVPVPNQTVTLDASRSTDVDHDPSTLRVSWDIHDDGFYDIDDISAQTLVNFGGGAGKYKVRLKVTDPASATSMSTIVLFEIPGEKKIAVESFTLIDADKDEAVRELEDGLIIKQSEWEGKTFSVRANTSAGMIDQVKFILTGPVVHEQIDAEPPYALFGDTPQGNFTGKALLPGKYLLTAAPYAGSEQGTELTVSFEVKGPSPSVVSDKTIGGTGGDDVGWGIRTQDGGYLLAGTSSSNVSGDKSENRRGANDYWIVKIDAHYNKLWDKTFGGADIEYFGGVISTTDGGYLIGGSSNSNISGDKTSSSNGSYDYWIVKTDNQGNKLWDKSFGGTANDFLSSMVATPDGGYILAGRSESDASGDKSENVSGAEDFWIIKIDSRGQKEWDRMIGGSGGDREPHIIATADGAWLLCGTSNSDKSGDKSEDSKGGEDYWLVKIDNQGNKVWDKTIGGSDHDIMPAIVAHDGGYLLVGTSISGASEDKSEDSKGSWDYWVVKIDAGGNKVWDKTLGGADGEGATCAVATPDGGYLVGGVTNSDESGDKSEDVYGYEDYWVVKIDGIGDKLWDKNIGGTSADNLSSIILTPAGNYLLTGSSDSNTSGDKSENSKGFSDYWIVEIKPPSGPGGTSLTLINAQTDQEIKALNDGDVIQLTETGTSLLDIRANINANNITKVVFELNGPVTHRQTERQSPYALFGNNQNDFNGRNLVPGAYTLKVIPFINDQEQAAVTISFTVTSGVTFTLMNAHTDQEIKALHDGDVIHLTETGTRLLDIRANITANNITKVVFELNGPVTHHQTERQSPYALFGNNQNDFNGRKLLPGAYTLKVIHYINDQEQAAVTVSFTVTPGVTFTLMNAHTDQEIKALNDGDVIRLTETGTSLLDIRANIMADNITKVVFELSGPVTHQQTERQSPYALFGNQQNNFNGRNLQPGSYTLKVTPFINDKAAAQVTVSFTVTDGFRITSFTLIDATLDQPVRTLVDGDVIDLSLFDHHKLAIRADTEPLHVDKVDLALQGPVAFSNTERVFPYVLFGDNTNNGITDYTGAKLFPGNYTLSATPYAGGHRGSIISISFEAIRTQASARQQVEVYPIPTSGVVNIRRDGIAGSANITVLDIYGNVLINRSLGDQPVEQLDLSKFRKGIYYLKVVGAHRLQIIRLVLE